MEHKHLDFSPMESRAAFCQGRIARGVPFPCARERVHVRAQDCVAAVNPLCRECATGERVRRAEG